MAEVEIRTSDGRVWNADEYALELGYRHGEIEFAQVMQNTFGVHTYERMQRLWEIRDVSKRRHPHHRSGSFPEGADITLE